ncbi:Acetoin utilization deacetylase AcuC [Neorhodopirellula lusitana]|uniref:Acetoin utilization deacetylase AcuC n=1 Tax=Neorhodopirellula lusitana TaxID=445327 RepID=A0ABY1Q833_9BACT|nr:histone deacetylase [Neorhodopirellula lusitana]SMP58492.1 Acetoin utilization deacetylase AcuC [Neorhodopirellula lusitana]
MRLYYTDHFELPLPETHRFPMDKYRCLRQHVVASPDHQDDTLLVPTAATDQQLLLCHDAEYLDRVVSGTLSKAEIRRIGFPWSPKMVERSRRSTGATIAASRAALADGVAANLAGGTHHAFADAGEGYCVFNDAAVAIRVLQDRNEIERAVVIDLDVHQGNGTASILSGDDSAITLSIHGVKNFPLRKVASDLDIALPDGTGDDAYLSALEGALGQMLRSGPFDLVIYLAGADPFQHDRLGRLSLTFEGLQRRDETVLRWCQTHGFPVAISMAGGYADRISDIVQIHATTLKTASRLSKLK